MRIFCDAAQNTKRVKVNSYGKLRKFHNGGHRVGIVVVNEDGERVAEAVYHNTKTPDNDQFAGECWSVLKAIEVAKELSLDSVTICNDRVGGFEASTKRGYIGAKYLWIAKKIATENKINVSFDQVKGNENVADAVSRDEDSDSGLRLLGGDK